MQHVELGEFDTASAHLLHGALVLAAPGIGECEPVERTSARLEHCLGLARNGAAPIDDRAKYIEE